MHRAIRYIGQEAIQTEITNFKAALEGVEVAEAFMLLRVARMVSARLRFP